MITFYSELTYVSSFKKRGNIRSRYYLFLQLNPVHFNTLPSNAASL